MVGYYESALRDIIKTCAPTASVFWGWDINDRYPAIALTLISENGQATMSGRNTLRSCDVQIDVFDKDMAASIELRNRVVDALDCYVSDTGSIRNAFMKTIRGEPDLAQDAEPIARWSLDFEIWYTTD